jgi:hypothetical protein
MHPPVRPVRVPFGRLPAPAIYTRLGTERRFRNYLWRHCKGSGYCRASGERRDRANACRISRRSRNVCPASRTRGNGHTTPSIFRDGPGLPSACRVGGTPQCRAFDHQRAFRRANQGAIRVGLYRPLDGLVVAALELPAAAPWIALAPHRRLRNQLRCYRLFPTSAWATLSSSIALGEAHASSRIYRLFPRRPGMHHAPRSGQSGNNERTGAARRARRLPVSLAGWKRAVLDRSWRPPWRRTRRRPWSWLGRRPGTWLGPWMARRRMGTAARLGPQTVVGLSTTAMVGLPQKALVGLRLPPTPVVGLAATLVAAAALRVGLVTRSPV